MFDDYNSKDLYRGLVFSCAFSFAYYYIARMSLKVHLAAKRTASLLNPLSLSAPLHFANIPNPTAKPPPEDLRARKIRRAFKFGSLAFTLAVLLVIVWSTHPVVKAAVMTGATILCVVPMYLMTVVMVRIGMNYYIAYVQPKPGSSDLELKGRKRPGSSWVRKTAATLLCAAFPYGAVLLQDEVCWSVLMACALCLACMSSTTSLKPTNARVTLIFAVVFAALMPVAIYSISRSMFTKSGEQPSTPDRSKALETFAKAFEFSLIWVAHVEAAVLYSIPMTLLCLCMRIDYGLQIDMEPGLSASTQLMTALQAGLHPKNPGSLQESHSLENSTVVSATLPYFKKPYFLNALATWALTTVVAVFLAPHFPYTGDDNDGVVWLLTYVLIACTAGVWAILSSILLTAVHRGEMKEIWAWRTW